MNEYTEEHSDTFDSYTFRNKESKPVVRFDFSNVHEERGTVHAEVSIYYLYDGQETPVVKYQRFNLQTEKKPGLDDLGFVAGVFQDKLSGWYETAKARTIEGFRKPIEAVDLTTRSHLSSYSGFLIDPLILGRGVSLLFAEGGTGKSFIGLVMCVIQATGMEIMGMNTSEVGPSLYVDYEDDIETHELRLTAVLASLDITIDDFSYPIKYIRPAQKLFKARSQIGGLIRTIKPRLIIVDSVANARGGDANAAEDTIQVFSTMRQFNTSVLALDHITKEDTRSNKAVTPFGSVFTINAVRLAWGMRATEGSTGINVGLILKQTKRNTVARHDPLSLSMEFVNKDMEVGEMGVTQPVLHGVKFKRHDVFGQLLNPVKPEKETQIDKIVTYLIKHGASTTGEMAAGIKEDSNSLGTALRREMKNGQPKVKRLPDTNPRKWEAVQTTQMDLSDQEEGNEGETL